ncbi:unnamed protein product [Durusdinium trenchii]
MSMALSWLFICLALTLAEAIVSESPQDESLQSAAPRLLLFWPVDGSKRTVALVKKNVRYVKSSLGRNCCKVFLAHYKGDAAPFGAAWYRRNVVGNLSASGYKFRFMQEAYAQSELQEPWSSSYDYVWGLDSDVDLTGTNLTRLFELTRASKALIVGPTFIGSGVNQKHPGGDLKKGKRKMRQVKRKRRPPAQRSVEVSPGGAEVAADAHMDDPPELGTFIEGERNDGALSDVASSRAARAGIWRFERPDPRCDYRHTDFVELTAPLLSMAALPLIFNECSSCIHEKSDWGLDMVWCNFLASKTGAYSCALLDATPVNHLNWKQAMPSKLFYDANREVHRKYRRFWAHMKTLSCVADPERTTISAEGLAPSTRHLVRKEPSH